MMHILYKSISKYINKSDQLKKIKLGYVLTHMTFKS